MCIFNNQGDVFSFATHRKDEESGTEYWWKQSTHSIIIIFTTFGAEKFNAHPPTHAKGSNKKEHLENVHMNFTWMRYQSTQHHLERHRPLFFDYHHLFVYFCYFICAMCVVCVCGMCINSKLAIKTRQACKKKRENKLQEENEERQWRWKGNKVALADYTWALCDIYLA